METLELKYFFIQTEDGFCRFKKKELILRHSNGLFYDYYVYQPYREVKVAMIRVPREIDSPDLHLNEKFFEISDGFLFNTRYLESYTIKDHKIGTRLDEMTDILPEMFIAKGRVRNFREALYY